MPVEGDVELTPLERSFVARAVSLLVCAGSFTAISCGRDLSLAWAVYISIVGVVAAFAWGLGAYRAGQPFVARVDGDGIWRDGVLLVGRSQITTGRLRTRPIWMTPRMLALEGRPGSASYLFRVADAATGQAALEKLHLDATHMRVSRVIPWIPFGRVDGTTFIVINAGWTLLFLPMLGLAFDGPTPANERATKLAMAIGLAVHLAFWIALRLRSPVTVDIGHEGLAITSGIVRRRTRVVPYEEITAVRTWDAPSGSRGGAPQGVDLVMAHGPEIRLHTRSTMNIGVVDEVAALIETAWTRHRHRRAQAMTADAPVLRLERDGRSLEGWAAELRQVGRGAASYRDLPADAEREQLLEALEDPTAAPERRAAAAFALRASPEPELHDRVRIVAGTVASPELRAALEELASAEEDAAEGVEALRRLEH